MRNKLFIMVVLGAVLCGASMATADISTITARYEGNIGTAGYIGGGTMTQTGTYNGAAYATSYYIGPSRFTNLSTGSMFYGFCIEPNQPLVSGTNTTWTLQQLHDAPVGAGSTPMALWQENRLKALWALHASEVFPYGMGSKPNFTNAIAFQAAVWEIALQYNIVNGNKVAPASYDVNAGWTPGSQTSSGFQVATWTQSNTYATLAESWINSAVAAGDAYSGLTLYAMTSPNTQDLLYFGLNVAPIPAPGAALLAVMGLSLIGWLKRRAA